MYLYRPAVSGCSCSCREWEREWGRMLLCVCVCTHTLRAIFKQQPCLPSITIRSPTDTLRYVGKHLPSMVGTPSFLSCIFSPAESAFYTSTTRGLLRGLQSLLWIETPSPTTNPALVSAHLIYRRRTWSLYYVIMALALCSHGDLWLATHLWTVYVLWADSANCVNATLWRIDDYKCHGCVQTVRGALHVWHITPTINSSFAGLLEDWVSHVVPQGLWVMGSFILPEP